MDMIIDNKRSIERRSVDHYQNGLIAFIIDKIKKNMKVKEDSIRHYILTRIDLDGYGIEQIESYKGLLSTLMRIFRRYGVDREKLGYKQKEIFSCFCGGLPSCFRVDFETYKQRELLKEWRIPISGYKDDEISDLFCNTIYETLIRWEDVSWK